MKHLRKCDGYVLPYVLVVFLILSAVAVSICATSLNNLKAQEAAVKRSQALYEAEGEVEKFVAAVMGINQSGSYESSTRASEAFMQLAKDKAPGEKIEGGAATSNSFTIPVRIVSRGVTIDASIKAELDIKETGSGTNGDPYRYKVDKIASLTYKSYDISYTGGDAG